MDGANSAATPSTIVIKLGSSSIIHEKTHQPLLSLLSSIVETTVHLKKLGHRVVLVSSGAIAVGTKRMELDKKPKNLSAKQALAAIGQGRLIALWDNLFGQLGQPIAQILLTRGDIADRTRYLNAGNTLAELLSLGVVPIVNENDTISVSEIRFGDNDTLSAITASMIHADYLFLLTDVEGLYTSNPRKEPNATLIHEVSSVAEIRSKVSTNTLGSSLGTGGMETKLIAADIATAAGVTTIIALSKNPTVVLDIVNWHISQRASLSTVPSAHSNHSPQSQPNLISSSLSSTYPLTRPPHTVFLPSPTPLRSLKSWTFHTLTPSGSVIVDHGAHRVLSRRDSGGRLLAAGVIGVGGTFAAGQAVRILARIQKPGEGGGEETPVFNSIPATPTLSRKGSHDFLKGRDLDRSDSIGMGMVRSTLALDAGAPIPEEELMEVGRGLANYNSAEIGKVKGLKSALISQVLGYADSEYVVENITIRTAP